MSREASRCRGVSPMFVQQHGVSLAPYYTPPFPSTPTLSPLPCTPLGSAKVERMIRQSRSDAGVVEEPVTMSAPSSTLP